VINESFKLLEKSNISWVNYELLADRIDSQYYSTKYVQNEIKLLKCGLKIDKLESISEWVKKGIFDMPAKFYLKKREEGIPFIRISNIKLLEFDTTDLVYIPKEIHKKEIKTELNKGDIVISKIGSIGNIGIINEELSPCNFSQNNIGIKMNGKIDSHYLATYMISKYCLFQLHRYSTIQVQSKLNLSDIRNLIVPIPSPEIQKYIGDKVRKAEELRKEAKRLKKEAEEIINESLNIKQLDFLWEGSKVKFEWTSTEILTDRIDANYYEQKYVETINHIKKFSKKYITLNSIIDSIYTGKKPIYYEKGIEAYFVQSGNISSNFLELDNKEKVDLSKYNQILFGDLLIAKDGETIGKIAINLTNETIIINEHTYCVRLKDEYKCYSAYIYYFLTNKYINPLIRREATGSAQKGLNFTFTENIIIPILEEDRIMNLYNLEVRRCNNIYKSKQLIQEAKQDVEDLIEGNFDMSKVKTKS